MHLVSLFCVSGGKVPGVALLKLVLTNVNYVFFLKQVQYNTALNCTGNKNALWLDKKDRHA